MQQFKTRQIIVKIPHTAKSHSLFFRYHHTPLAQVLSYFLNMFSYTNLLDYVLLYADSRLHVLLFLFVSHTTFSPNFDQTIVCNSYMRNKFPQVSIYSYVRCPTAMHGTVHVSVQQLRKIRSLLLRRDV